MPDFKMWDYPTDLQLDNISRDYYGRGPQGRYSNVRRALKTSQFGEKGKKE